MIKKWQVFFLSGCGRRCTLIVGNYFSHNLRIFPVGYKIKKIKPQLAYLSNMKFSCNRCVCNTVIIFYYNGIPLEMFLLSIKFNGKSRLPGIQDSMS